MSLRLKAIYKDGAFVPIPNGEKLNVSENAEVEITVHDPNVVSATATSDEERERVTRIVRKLGRTPASFRRSASDSGRDA